MGRALILLFWIICVSQRIINVSGCQLQGVNPILVRVTVNVLDVDRGVIYNNQIIDIAGVTDVVQNPGLNSGPYIRGYISGTTFYLETTDNFAQYEEHETESSIILNAQLRCSDGTSITQVFQVDVQDTNNNSPVFLPSNEYEIAIATPLLPGHQITGCAHNIVVRDIDLTTSRIDFALTGSDLFEIEYDEESSTNAKEFVAILRTRTFIRTLPDPVELTISATDVDATGDPPRTTYATVRITADSDAVLPEEPVFSQALYMATYTEDNTINLDEQISLQQGYHDDVSFSLDEDYSSYFGIIRNGNDVSLSVTTPLSAEILTRQQLYLIISANREFTSGATATVVVQLPEEIGLQFERANYEGVIEDNTLALSNLVLTQGYEGAAVTVSVSNDFFSADIQGSIITLSMQPLTQEIIDGNTFLNLEVTARTERSLATTIVTLEIVKDDTVTPVFQSPIYIGSYDTEIGLTLGEMELTQGFDNTVEVSLDGEHSTYFQLIRNGAISTLAAESLPLEELGEQTIILTIHASKPRTVGATASIYISLPEEKRLAFQQASYEGSIIDNTLQVPNLILTQGYENLAVNVAVSNDLFTGSIQGNVITLTMGQLSDAMIQENSFLNLEVTATTSRSSASTIVTLEIIKDDTITPLFESALYSGTYTVQDGLTLGQINVVQGYDETVDITLHGDHSNLFQLVRDGATSTLTGTVPPALFSQRNIALTVTATKPRTVGSTAVINIALPTDRVLEFGATTYRGTYQNNILTLGVITLSTGYDDTVVFQLSDYNQYFEASNDLNQVSIQQLQPLPDAIILENNFLALTVTASGLNALSASASVLIEIIKDDISTPVFSQNIYSGAYADGSVVIQDIHLIQGYDPSVTFRLDGENSEYFSLSQVENANAVTVSLTSAIPEEVIFNEKTLVFSLLAEKPLTVGANTAILITFPSELTDPAILRFSQNTYIGSLEDGNLAVESIILNTGYAQGTRFLLTGDYSSYFGLSNTNEVLSITTLNTLPQEVIEENKFIVLEVEARRDRAVSVFSSVIIGLIHDETIVEIPVFNAAYYRGSYSLDEGLQFTEQVYLVQGYDNTVLFELQGEHSEFFSVSENNNVITLSASAIPENVWESNNQLIFSLVANKPDIQNGQAAIVIDMPKEILNNVILGFERTSYQGSINNEVITLDPITLSEGYTADVIFTLHGELQSYFTLSRNGATVTLGLPNAIPEGSLPSNGIIVLELQASTTSDSLPAVTTVILEVIRDTTPDVEELVFAQTYYIGTYTTTDGLTFENTISLGQGYDESVQFTLDGDDSIYFTITQTGNSASLTMLSAIPPAVIANNNQLVFLVKAQSSGGTSAEATIIISLLNEVSDNVILGFERTSYQGSLNNEVITLDPITLSEGYTADVIFTLHGELQSYFTLSRNGATVSLGLPNAIPEGSLPSNGIIVLELQASTTSDSLPAVTTVILEVIRDTTPDVEELVFAQTYYIGTYTTTDGLTFENTISLGQGYDESVQFTLDGDDSIYFTITQTGNSASLTMLSAIPPAVIANNNQLVFLVSAQSSGGTSAEATIIISLLNEVSDNVILGFERTSYQGSINNEVITLDPITLSEGYTADVIFTLHGELQSYFTLSRNGATVTLSLPNAIPEGSLPSNGIIVLELQASTTSDSLPAVTTVILEVIRDTTPDVEELVFAQTYYIGTYTTTDGLTFENTISLVQGYDESVQFTLDGDDSIYFTITQTGNSASLTMLSAIPPAVIANNNQLVFLVSAQSSGGTSAEATIIISLLNEVSDNVILGFERTSYQGSINNDVITLDPITLSEGYTADVIFTLHGELQSYFTLSRNGATVTLGLPNAIPEGSLPSNGIIVLELQASTTSDSLPAVTTVILEVIRDTTPDVEELVFAQTYYIGTYTTTDGLTFENTISLGQGYDESVQFTLDGDDSIYFTITQTGNSASLTMLSAIPPAVIANNNQLVFLVSAQSSRGTSAEATIIISLLNEVSDNVILGFERTSYQGFINNDVITLDPITLSEGYTADVIFTLHGELQSYFTLSRNGATVTLGLPNAIPEGSLPSNGIIVLELQASTTSDSLPAVTTVILEVIRDTTPDVEELVFAQTYYIGTYTTTDGLTFENTISLGQGYDESVQFTLDGDDSIYFTITQTGNSASLTMLSAIPPAVIANNNQLVFLVSAQSSRGTSAEATIIISLLNEVSDNVILGFERTSYQGSINNDVITLDLITLSEGYTADVIFTLHGELQSYFTLSRNGATVNLVLPNAIPEGSLPSNGIIVLELQASTTSDSLPAVTTVILEVIRDTTPDVEELVFAQTYYIGTYTTTDGLTFENTISLGQGYDESVQFTLDGDDSIYFTITQTGNSASLTMLSAIPPAVIANNNQLVFLVSAQSSGGTSAEATIIISLLNEVSDNVILGFERTSYQGSINNDVITLDPITLSEGYTADVIFTLHGELQSYFTLSRNGATVTLGLPNAIPEGSLPSNGIIVLELQASTTSDSLPAVTTVILEVIRDTTPDVEELVFAQTYYIGTYTTTDGLTFENTISLGQGYDESVQFTLDGDDSIYFTITQTGNSASLTMLSAIPPAVIANNNQLVFLVSAQSSRGTSAEATIIISLLNEVSDNVILGFERTSYQGSINNDVITLDPITLSEGYTADVIFTLHGELQSYFTLSRNGATVTLGLPNAIPEGSLPSNGIIVLELQASTTSDSLPAVTTVILEVIRDTTPDVEELVFAQTYYIGTYTTTDGLTFENTISLGQGYDESVQFTLDGDDSIYFTITQTGNSASLTMLSAIPPAVIANNNQLVFLVSAQSSRGTSAEATIIISLLNEVSDNVILGFERTSYQGSINNDVITLDLITLSEGYTADVIFTLHGELKSYFTLSRNGATVNLVLPNAIPEGSLPSNGIIVLELQASTTSDSLPAVTTVILEVIRDTTPDVEELVFAQTYYIGTYTTTDGLTFENTISLGQGYDESVQFTLDGDDSIYFMITQTGNSASLTMLSAIPPAVIANNNQLVFLVSAQSSGGTSAEATIIISLLNEVSDNVILGFERTSYQGSINNDVITLDPITLSEGYTAEVIFTLHGELQSYFTLSRNGATVNLVLPNAIPEGSLPSNGIIVLELQASTTSDSLPAVTTVILEVIRDTTPDVEELVFAQTYYIGTYTTTDGLTFENTISLGQGYDESVQFTLDGDDSIYFTITQTGNSASLTMLSAIPPAVIANNNQLVFLVSAQSSRGTSAEATIIISLLNEVSDNVILGFERTSYQGSINNDVITLDPITLSEGYTADVIFTLHGELQSYFTFSRNGATVTLSLPNAIPEGSLPSNGIIVLELQASTTSDSLPAVTTVILEVIRDTTPDVEELVFAQTYYIGTYTTTDGLTLENTISLEQGYDESVQFTLDGDDSIYFTITQTGNSASLTMLSAIPPAVIANNNQLVFLVSAQSSRGTSAEATIIISLLNEVSDNVILGFERTSYQGSINNDVITLDPITLSEGYTADVIFTLHGELQSYFTLSRNGATVNLVLPNAIPEGSLPSNGIIVLDLQASTTSDSLPAVTTVILEVIRDTTPDVEELVFAQTYYIGTYTTTDGLTFENTISLGQGYDESVQFTLDGDDSIYFTITQTGNSASLTMLSAIPPAVIANNNQLVFLVSAQSSGGTSAEATIIISLLNEVSDNVILGFERTSYQGSINNDVITLDPITLSEGYTADVIFTLHGELQSYFTLSRNGATVTLGLPNAIPEGSLPSNGIIVLELQASTTSDSLPAVTTVILEVIRDTTPDVEELVFAQTYYIGTYTTTDGLTFENTISLGQGYDESVQFTLDGDDSIYFTITQTGNSASLTMLSAIPPAVIANNNQLVFLVSAQSSGGTSAEATIIISLLNEVSDNVILGFERTSYQGSINNDVITLDPITLSEGYTADVIFTLHGELQSYFTLSRNGATVNLVLPNAIPEGSLPSNGIIVLDLQASTTSDSLPAVTTVILEVIRDTTPDVEELVFAQTYYIGTYTTTDGLTFENTISLGQGYDESVQFTLDGDDSIYFTITQTGNSASLTMLSAIPPAVIANNNQLVFLVSAQSSGGTSAEATIIISLLNEVSDNVILGFERTSYQGSINNDVITLDPITLSEGYTADVIFTLHGELQSYFTLSRNGATVTLGLPNAIPEGSLPSNGIIVLELQASTTSDSLPAVTTVILEVIRDTTPDVEELVFAQTYYIGTYTTTDGLTFENTISLGQGYDESVQFTLDGDDSIYFTITQTGNSASLTMLSAIPPAVIANNNQLVFLVSAQSSGGTSAEATIIISLLNEVSDNVILGFERTSYQGSINNDVITLDPITLSEGYTAEVIFTLHGELQSYFTLSRNGATVNLVLPNAIPEGSLPSNGIIVLELQASTTSDSLPALTTVILEVIRDTTPDVEELVFAQTYYIGTYTTTDGLTFENTISLGQGYDESVQFTLDGDDSIYFTITQTGNSASLTMLSAIPPAVIANNNQLVFLVSAQSSGGTSAEATIIISLLNEVSDNVILGFERTSYQGSINNDVITLDPITLSEGYTAEVIFTLHGELQSYFTLSRNGATVNLVLPNAIPEGSLPSNGIIVLELQASTTSDSLPAVTTVILEVIRDTTPDVEELVFAQTYYIGTYTTTDGLTFENTISLGQGYDESVQFTLDGDDSIYFTITQTGNSASLTMLSAIPPAVIANNNQLVFLVSAQSSGGTSAEATIIISLLNEVSDNVILGFERTSYQGSINNDVITLDPITLSEGYTADVIFTLHGELQSYFTLSRNGATVTLSLPNAIPEGSLPSNGIIVLELQASTTSDSLPAVTTVILEVIRDTTPDVEELVFAQTYYIGTYTTTDGLTFENTISLGQGYDESVQFTLDGDDSIYFTITQTGNSASLTMQSAIPPAVVSNNNHLVFLVSAQSSGGTSAQATIIISLPNEISNNVILGFERTSYQGSINNEVITLDPITLSEGYTADVIFTLHGELESYFGLLRNGATVIVQMQTAIPEDLVPSNGIIILGIQASTAGTLPAVATIVLKVERSDGGPTVTFSKVLYEGLMHADTIEHETITVMGYDETMTVTIRGVYSELFTASLVEGMVTVQRTGSVTLPTDVAHVAVEIHVGDAAAVLLLQVYHTDTPSPQPTVTFNPSNYVVRAEVLQTGVIGRVSATADNGESLVFSVAVEDAHLAARLSVNNEGELLLASPANSGEYTFQVLATTLITQATGTATVHLTIDETSIVMSPLIVLDRDEEEAHDNLVVFNSSDYSDCTYSLTNRFPANQDWLYVNEIGLHARVIDREDPSIAFMALSQVQVELEVHCNSFSRSKRSPRESRLDWLGPYDYGTSNWILGESIEYNPMRSVVNLIVNDINDNAPIFVGKENEPIAVGYPVPDLEPVVLPRALVELQATDADVGENAAIVYWSAEPALAVSPTSGSVHVRDDVTLEQDLALVVHASDQNGRGLSGSINLVVKLLDVSNIAVVTIRDAFLEDEPSIIANLSSSVGYEVKVLRAVVISDETESIEEDIDTRKKRETRGSGASLELYVYGLVQREPVAVETLTEDLNSGAIEAISIARTISLRDHLEARQISSGRDVGLLVATIVLSILLFILIVAILVWYFLKWRKERNYDEFSDENSLESRNESIAQPPKVDIRPKPRIDIDELKRSERRLQEMIDAPYNEVVTPTISSKAPVESVIDISKPDPNILIPIVINDKLKDADEDPSDVDEFGEIRPPRRKSVVTFNENVERIIHVDDNIEGGSTSSDIEIFRL